MKKSVLGAIAVVALVAGGWMLWGHQEPVRTAGNSATKKWRVVGGLESGGTPFSPFVVVSPDAAKDRSTYDDAVANVCRGHSICLVAFFLPGDKIPPSQKLSDFYKNGGWSDYKTLAYWVMSDYTGWDCERAGDKGAPFHALCGPFVREAYGAILSVASRTGMAQFCGWEDKEEGVAFVHAYIEKMKDAARKEQFRQAFQEHSSSEYGGTLENCTTYGARVESNAKDALKFLREHQL